MWLWNEETFIGGIAITILDSKGSKTLPGGTPYLTDLKELVVYPCLDGEGSASLERLKKS